MLQKPLEVLVEHFLAKSLTCGFSKFGMAVMVYLWGVIYGAVVLMLKKLRI